MTKILKGKFKDTVLLTLEKIIKNAHTRTQYTFASWKDNLKLIIFNTVMYFTKSLGHMFARRGI